MGGYELIRRTFDALLEKYPREQVVGSYVFVLDELRKHLESERDRLSRGVFEALLDAGKMRFIVVADELGFNRLSREIRQPSDSEQANRTDGSPYQRGRIYADFIATLRPDDPDVGDALHQVFVIETKGLHLKHAEDTA